MPRKKPPKLTEEDLKRYERALQLWEAALRRQEAELNELELELLVPSGSAHHSDAGNITLDMMMRAYEDTLQPQTHGPFYTFDQNFIFEEKKPATDEWLENLYKLKDPRNT